MTEALVKDGAATQDAAELERLNAAADLALIRALAETFRDILRAAIAGAVAGVVVAGLGGRIVMRVAALMNPQAVGLETENGNLIGDITLGGTVALVMFGGLFAGLLGSVVWTAVAPWIPGRGLRRALLAAPIAVALAGFFLVRSDNDDFLILRSDLLIVGTLLAMVAAFGFCLALLDDRLDRRLPRPGTDPRQFALTAGALVVFGSILALPLTIGSYFGEPACLCAVAPLPLAVPLIVAAVATVVWWSQRALGRAHPSAPVVLVGRLGLLTAIALGAALLATEVAAIPV